MNKDAPRDMPEEPIADMNETPEAMSAGPENPPTHYVGIGASAGGLEAIESFFANMPQDSGMGFIIIQHLSPDYKSLMVELLSKRTLMPVYRAEEGMQVQANSLYLIPPRKNLTIFHGRLLLTEQDHAKGLNLPIDVFLRSLAEDQGEKAVAVILSGTGSDGMRGVRAIKEHGGMVMVQDEESAKFDGMPRSAISTGLADFVLPTENMPGELMSFVNRPYGVKASAAPLLLTNEDGMSRIFALLRDMHKVDFTFYKPSTLVRRIERRMNVNQTNDLSEYVAVLESNPREVKNLYRELLIGVTSFFRDPEAFDLLGTKGLPELLLAAGDKEIRFWTAGCSTGEEAYTLAIACQECKERLRSRAKVKIFATDVDRESILYACNGTYPESIAADLSPALLSKYFQKRQDNFQVTRNLREMVVFAQHNLVKDPPFTNIDLISCRNLLIYLQPVLQIRALEMFNFSLNPKGILFLGSSETVGEMADYFDVIHPKWKLYRAKGRKRVRGTIMEMDRRPMGRAQLMQESLSRQPSFVARPEEDKRLLQRFLAAVAEDYLPLSIIVNENMEVLHTIGEAAGYFRPPSGRMHNDLSKMAVKELAIPLGAAIQKAFKSGQDVRYANIAIRRDGAEERIDLRVRPFPARPDQERYAVVFLEQTGKRRTGPHDEGQPSFNMGEEVERRIQDLEQELQFTRENLQATIEELETSNEELQATNEELLASNEELQSTNEELQSVNEELYTVNAEYQRKIVELTELNNDIENLLVGLDVGTLFLDENLDVRKFTPQAAEIFRIISSDVGRPISHLSNRLKDIDILDIIQRVQEESKGVDIEVEIEGGSWRLMRVMPYSVAPKTFSGVVLTFTNIDALKSTQSELAASDRQNADLLRNLQEGLWVIDQDGGTSFVNERMAAMLGYAPEEMLGRSVEEFIPEDAIAAYRSNIERRKGGQSELHDFELLTRDGRRIQTRMAAGPIMDRDGRYSGAIAGVVDITDLKEAEDSLREKNGLLDQRMRELDCLYAFSEIASESETITEVVYSLTSLLPTCFGKAGSVAARVELLGQTASSEGFDPAGIRRELDVLVEGERGGRLELAFSGPAPQDDPPAGSREELALLGAIAERLGRVGERFKNTGRLMERDAQLARLSENMLSGYALHEIVLDERGVPVDYVFLQTNGKYFEMTGLPEGDLTGKRVTEVFPGIEQADMDWIGIFGKVALTGEQTVFDAPFAPTGRRYRINAFQEGPKRFATIFQDIGAI